MKKIIFIIGITSLLSSCRNEVEQPISVTDNPLLKIEIPANFPAFNQLHSENPPTQYGVELGKKLFHDPILSGDNSVSCATCHQKQKAFADSNTKAVGIHGRVGLRNSPPIQNMAFMNLYMWDGAVLDLKEQPRIPIVNPDEMDSSVLQIIAKIKTNKDYINLFQKAFGDDLSDNKTAVNHLLRSLAQYMSTLISANSKYDKVMRNEGETFTPIEQQGYTIFQNKCATCHSGALLTDESFRNIGFPKNPDRVEEKGRAKVTGRAEDLYKFRVPSLRNIEYTAPYGSFGQFATLEEVLDYLGNGVEPADNLDPILKNNGNKIPLNANEKLALIAFLKTLSDKDFVGK